jgi:cysteinyl-tRNA synthetase
VDVKIDGSHHWVPIRDYLQPVSNSLTTFADPNLVPSLLDDPPSCRFSILTLSSGWPDDLERLTKSLDLHCVNLDYEIVAVSNASPEVEKMVVRLAHQDRRVRPLLFSQNVGFGGGRNAAIVQSRGEYLVIADTSIEATGDFLPPIAAALGDRSVGLTGKWGLTSSDMRHFHEVGSGECDAIEAYCVGFRRADVKEVGMFDAKYKFYRNADIDWSMRWRDRGYRLLATDLPLERHAHREWESLTPDQREKKSRDNFARFLRSWRDRTDLLTGRDEPHD